MLKNKGSLTRENKPLGNQILWAFGLLALGDTGHVGFRVLEFLIGDSGIRVNFFGQEIGLLGAGTLCTAYTVSFFYLFMLYTWKTRYQESIGWFGSVLILAFLVRLIIMLFPQNNWNNPVSSMPWSFYRNLPLLVSGLGVSYLMLRDGYKNKDQIFIWFGYLIISSFAFYTPVVLLSEIYPLIGILMIPKTITYVVIAAIAYFKLFKQQKSITENPKAL
jgi:hypothetical protein